MKVAWKRALAMAAVISITASTARCSHKQEKTPKPKPQATAVVDNGNTDAKGKGEGQADVPLVIGCNKLDGKFNPFIAKSEDDQQASGLTQIYLLENDRNGNVVCNGIDGEIRAYNNRDYTYYGPADVKITYNKKKDETVYKITLRDDLKFSDGEPVTIDDVLFTIYVLCDKSYKGTYSLGRQDIRGLSEYQKNKKVKSIAGIKRIDNYTMSVTTNGFDISMVQSLRIPICPLHYYGNKQKYHYNRNKFGFKKGDALSVCGNKKPPIGAGAYRFVKYENGIVYYASNELYYKGCPKIAYLQLKEMEDILNAAQEKINKAIEEEQAQGINYNNDTQPESTVKPSSVPEGTINHNPEALEMTEGTVDIINTELSEENLFWLAYANSNGEISGNKIATSFVPEGVYQYIGINAGNVKAGRNIYSKESRNLRKAFATAFSAFKDELYNSYTEYARLIQYPLWLPYTNGKEEEMPFYNKDINGNVIYKEDADDIEKYENVKEAVLSYLEAAGYTINGMSVTEAPDGAEKSYTLILDGGSSSPLYQMASKTAALFKDIGMELKITDIQKENPSGKKSGNKKRVPADLWSGESRGNAGGSLYNQYINNNRFGLSRSGISKLLKHADSTVREAGRQKRYMNCYKNIWNLAAEVPLNELQSIDLYSSARIDIDTMPKDVTVYYNWLDEIEDIEMK